MESTLHPFTLTIDWLAFTVPNADVTDVKQLLGGDWVLSESGFRGYPRCWINADGVQGVGMMGNGKLKTPKEIHVDLSAGIVSTWPFAKVKDTLRWIFDHEGHPTRIDCALDDRKSLVSLEQIKQAVAAGQCLTRAEQFKAVAGSNIDTGSLTGETLYFGSRASRTMLRIYNKQLEMQHKGREDWQEFGIRWELEFRKERAEACGLLLRSLDEEEWCRCAISLLRAFIDFRETTREDEGWVRYRLPLVPWWAELTEGLEKCRLHVGKEVKSLEQVMGWAERALAPMLAVLKEGAGTDWLNQMIDEGAQRWRPHHRRLLKGKHNNGTLTYRLRKAEHVSTIQGTGCKHQDGPSPTHTTQ
jgi:DNA relaxase NicK